MIIILTKDQLKLIKERIIIAEKEYKKLRMLSKTESISGWDFVALDDEICNLNEIIQTGKVCTNTLHVENFLRSEEHKIFGV